MPARTPYRPDFRGEADLWDSLLRLDDGFLNLWHSVTPTGGTEVDLLLLDTQSGAFCIEIKALPMPGIAHLDLQSMERRGGSIGPSPFLQALFAARALGGVLDNEWPERPFLVPVAAFPLISRTEWTSRFPDGPVGEAVDRCLLKDDFRDLESLRTRLSIIAENPVGGMPRRADSRALDKSDAERLHAVLFEVTPEPISVAILAAPEKQPLLYLLEETIQLLEGHGAVYGSEGLTALRAWQDALAQENDRLRVSVIGEFKAGKSSLINAILRREVCFVDEFEATSTSAVYVDGPTEHVDLEFANGSHQRWTVDEFLERCSRRDLGEVTRATVSIRTGLPFDLADSPGLGTQTRAHASRAEEEIRQTDLLVWAVDCQDAGSAQEGAFIARARELGLPIIVLLTKADVLDDGEEEALIEYFVGETGIYASNVYAVSAMRYRQEGDAGVDRLLDRLLEASRGHREVQRQSRQAKNLEVADSMSAVLRRLLESNTPHARYVAAERGYLETSALGISEAAKSQWISALRKQCALVVMGSAVQSATDVSSLEAALELEIPRAFEATTASLFNGLRNLVRDEWKSALTDRASEFETRMGEMLRTRPDATADLDFLRHERDGFLGRAQVVSDSSRSNEAYGRRLMAAGAGAVCAVLMASFVPLAIGGLAAAFLIKDSPSGDEPPVPRLDPALSARIEDALVSSFHNISPQIEWEIDRMVAEIAVRSLVRLVDERGGPSFETILVVERKANELLDELAATRGC